MALVYAVSVSTLIGANGRSEVSSPGGFSTTPLASTGINGRGREKTTKSSRVRQGAVVDWKFEASKLPAVGSVSEGSR